MSDKKGKVLYLISKGRIKLRGKQYLKRGLQQACHLLCLSSVLLLGQAYAGPVLLGGDDLTDHGGVDLSTSTPILEEGWIYIARSLENIAPQVTRAGNDGSVAVLGSEDSVAVHGGHGGNAGAAYHFAVPEAGANTASLSGTVTFHNDDTGINAFFADLNAGTINPAIIVLAGTGASNDLTTSEGLALTANALAIGNFVNSGGGLLSHGSRERAYGWLSALIPAASNPSGCDNDTLTLTTLGQLTYPTLTNAIIASDACHSHFLNHGLDVIATDKGGALILDPGSTITLAETEPNNTINTSNVIAIGDDYTGSLPLGDAIDYVSFAATAGDSIAVVAIPSFFTYIELLDTDGLTALASTNPFVPVGTTVSLAFPIATTGTYFLRILTYQGQQTNYTINLRTGVRGPRDIIIGGNITLPGQVTLTPQLAFNAPNTNHTVIANVVDLAGSIAAGESIAFEVVSGPESGTTGTSISDSNGNASFAYTNSGSIGLDEITGSFVNQFGTTVQNTVRNYWDQDCQANNIPDSCDVDCGAYNNACLSDYPSCGGSADNDSNGLPDECNTPPVCSNAIATPASLWPPNHAFKSISIDGVTDADGDTVAISVTSIFQDEAVDAAGSGNTAPDAQGIGTDSPQVRAERKGGGNGRVYHINFTADDAKGGTCQGEVTVGVPHNKKSTPVDGGSLFDSTLTP